MYCEDYENYYEPTIADEILMEFHKKMKDALLDSVKNELDSIKEENKRLKEYNDEFKKREKELLNKERDLKHKEDNCKREVEKEFYESNIGDTLKRYIDDCELWYAEEEYIKRDKCGLCNENRKLIASFSNGKEAIAECDCGKLIKILTPHITTERIIKFSKRNSRYASERVFYFSKNYSPSKDSCREYHYSEFKIGHVADSFNDETKKIYENLNYGEKLGFRIKEECQKYCDWLNSK